MRAWLWTLGAALVLALSARAADPACGKGYVEWTGQGVTGFDGKAPDCTVTFTREPNRLSLCFSRDGAPWIVSLAIDCRTSGGYCAADFRDERRVADLRDAHTYRFHIHSRAHSSAPYNGLAKSQSIDLDHDGDRILGWRWRIALVDGRVLRYDCRIVRRRVP